MLRYLGINILVETPVRQSQELRQEIQMFTIDWLHIVYSFRVLNTKSSFELVFNYEGTKITLKVTFC